MRNVPPIPMMTANDHTNIEILIDYLYRLNDFLTQYEPVMSTPLMLLMRTFGEQMPLQPQLPIPTHGQHPVMPTDLPPPLGPAITPNGSSQSPTG